MVYLAQSDYRGPLHLAGLRMSAYEFHRQVMNALGVDTTRLTAQPMPTGAGLMRDTSLDSARWWRMRDAEPLSIKDALRIEREKG